MTASYKSGLVDGLFAPEHRERMGEAIWLFGWLVARQTAQKDAVGFVLSGKVMDYGARWLPRAGATSILGVGSNKT